MRDTHRLFNNRCAFCGKRGEKITFQWTVSDTLVAIGLLIMIGVTLAVTMLFVIPGFIPGFFGGMPEQTPVTYNMNISIIEKLWDGNSNHWGYITTSTGEGFHVQDGIVQMRFQINHTYNVEIDTRSWRYPVIIGINYEVPA